MADHIVVREFEGQQWVPQADYEAVLGQFNETQSALRHVKRKFMEFYQELQPEQAVGPEQAVAPEQLGSRLLLTKISGQGLDVALEATVQIYRIEVSGQSSSSNSTTYLFLPTDVSVLCASDGLWSQLSTKQRDTVGYSVSAVLCSKQYVMSGCMQQELSLL